MFFQKKIEFNLSGNNISYNKNNFNNNKINKKKTLINT